MPRIIDKPAQRGLLCFYGAHPDMQLRGALDPTNDVPADQGHVTLAIGRDYSDVSLLRGVILGGGAHQVEVAVNVNAD